MKLPTKKKKKKRECPCLISFALASLNCSEQSGVGMGSNPSRDIYFHF